MDENELIDLKKKIHDHMTALWARVLKTDHPAKEDISTRIRYVLFCNMRNDFREMETWMISLINLSKRFDITWECMDCLDLVKRARRISEISGVNAA